VRDVDECRRRAVRLAEGRLNLLGDVDELGLAIGLEADLPHPVILGASWRPR
jgi:hypothetical protein